MTNASAVFSRVSPLKPSRRALPKPVTVAGVRRPLPAAHERSGVHLLTRADLDIVSEMDGRAARLVLELLYEDRAAFG